VETHWEPIETTTHQDHVIAHVLGTSVLGSFVHDETLHLVLDIGFIWSIYLDGQMVLLPHPVAVAELQLDEAARAEISVDVDCLLGQTQIEKLNRLIPVDDVEIEGVELYGRAHEHRIVLRGFSASITIDSSENTRSFRMTLS
jgi:hypothetical protein